MVNALEAPAEELIKRVALKLKRMEEIKPPEWAYFVKTGIHEEAPPIDSDWWYIRAASIMRRLYKTKTPVGTERLRTVYGGRSNLGSMPEHFRKSGGAIIRSILQQLQKAGLVQIIPRRGRVLTSTGVSLLDNVAHEILKELAENKPALKHYLE
ncbi:MAG: 30S ribosomal protein S19e [Desulfurococcales archaeon]|nr:30S ribosomal protein S19e [Desulfurococcales archaeon]